MASSTWSQVAAIAVAGFAAVTLAGGLAGEAHAFPFGKQKPPPVQVSEDRLDQIQRALDEKRLMDAGRLIDAAMLSGASHPRLSLLAGELGLARGRHEAAIQAFRAARSMPTLSNAAMQGEALAMVRSGRGGDALPLLKEVVAADPKAWRAWNALGAVYDGKQAWSEAEQAYEQALSAAPHAAAPLNNRGYSRLLQGRLDAAVGDFVAALQKQPDLAEGRANLRLALALRGEYDRAIDGSNEQERAVLLNNAALAAGARGDFRHAEGMLQKAMTSKGEYYQKAADNLTLLKELERRTKSNVDAAR